MSQAMKIECQVHFQTQAKGRKRVEVGDGPRLACEPGRVPRVARLLALAHRFDGLLRDGLVKDYADLARLGHVTRARISQIMSLLLLAPDLQEQVLFLPRTVRGRDPIQMYDLLPITLVPDWKTQRRQGRPCA
jgi:hypothetical protein